MPFSRGTRPISLKRADIGVLSDEFLEDVRHMKERNLAAERRRRAAQSLSPTVPRSPSSPALPDRQFHDRAGDRLPTHGSVSSSCYRRAILSILIAAAAAPKPLSMFIAMTPGAQLDSAAFRAAAPPEAYPTAHGRRRGDNRRANQAGNDTGQRPFHASRNDDDAGFAQPPDLSVEPPQPGDPTSAIGGAACPWNVSVRAASCAGPRSVVPAATIGGALDRRAGMRCTRDRGVGGRHQPNWALLTFEINILS